MVVGDIGSYNPPVCYFCNKQGSMMAQDDLERVKVRAADEEVEEAKMRPVCSECDPRVSSMEQLK